MSLHWPARFGHRWHYRRSLASRITVLTTFVVALSVAAVALGAFVVTRAQLRDTLDSSLIERARTGAQIEGLDNSVVNISSFALGAGDIRIAVLKVTASGIQVRAAGSDGGSGDIVIGDPEYAVATGDSTESLRSITSEDGEHYRVVAVPVPNQDGEALVLAQSLSSQETVLANLGVVTLVLGLAGVLVAALAGFGVARSGLRPVRRFTAGVEEIGRTQRLEPLDIEGDDEIARLGVSFNQMLGALSSSRERQKRLVADAGHELRTPLTSLRTNIELLAQARSDEVALPPEAVQEVFDDVRAQVEELSTLVGDLVELARDEELGSVMELVDVAEVVEHALGRVRRRAPGAVFETHLASWWMRGEPGTLERAVTNLLDNAAKWSPAEGRIVVTLADGVLVVDDEGPGIPDADLPHVFERFYRADESRTMPGSGLGLSIVAQAAERHAGAVHAERSPMGGARLVLQLPGQPEEPSGTSSPDDALLG
ncbi:HAMP domain-containing sensor histidine kinase [Nocardioides sp. GY 10127]|uniref:sensor histidine kinase n=1 Tax=Nocardioides sp. GY 10127 TaxID=2569762 RepID=UPI0010A79E66|nr:HAMP domain-containing sensor histidine kinase [Nocardioides sp. GY 10127]TIC82890.1 HAMP domain-containing histidine kinase [Nocardioides sp. GY 10127]